MPRTRIEEIVAAHAVGWEGALPPASGDVVWLQPDRLMTHDNTSAVMARFRAAGGHRVAHPERCVVVLDHDVQNRSEAHARSYAAIAAFAREQELEFHPAGSGIGHQIMIERAHARPGALVVAADSHANMYGAEGALGVPVTRADAASIWARGIFWWEIPPVARVVLHGRLRPESTAKDAALVLCALYPDDVLGLAVELQGPGLATLAADDRRTLANLTTEWGASACLVVGDAEPPVAGYAATLELDLGEIVPHVSGPDTLTRAEPLASFRKRRVPIDKAYLVSCANARATDLAAAAAALEGGRIADGVRLYVAAASAAVEQDARASGAWDVLVAAGATILPSGCGPCIGLGAGLLEAGETGISASNRNFKGRMGSADANCYLASPAVVAASARAGYITGPGERAVPAPTRRITRHPEARSAPPSTAGTSLPALSGRMVVLLADGIDTDALCPARFVYADDTAPQILGAAVLAAVDAEFASRARPGDVLVAGARFGVGSSREQAVTALKALGLRAVVAASLAPSFRRNAWNNGLPALEAPAFVERLKARLPASLGSTIPGGDVLLDFAEARISYRDVQAAMARLPGVAHDLLAAGGLDGFLRRARVP